MTHEATIENRSVAVQSSSLQQVTEPVQESLAVFRDFFKKEISSDVWLLARIIHYLLRQKGKEIRPTLVFMTARTFGEVDHRSYVGATMIELVHTATLIEDEVVDEADVRRGIVGGNKIWNNQAGVLLGDF